MSIYGAKSNIDEITKHSELQEVYALYINRLTTLNQQSAEGFKFNQEVKFKSTDGTWTGKIEAINNKGKIKIRLNPGQHYDTYSIGALSLRESLIL